MNTTLYVAISAHGYGHIAQTAPVVNELHRRDPTLRIVIECAASRELLEKRFEMPFEHVQAASDFGMVMKNALEVDVEASHARYVELHARLEQEVEASVRRLQGFQADLLLANIPYIPLLAARRVGIPSVAMCCLNWADIYSPLRKRLPGAERIYTEIGEAYRAAGGFLGPQPYMPMPAVGSLTSIGPIGRLGRPQRAQLQARHGFERLVVVTMGGIETRLDFVSWPVIAGAVWAVPDGSLVRRGDMVRHSDFDVPFIDLLASCDALITKPGYGAFAEAAINGVPVLYVPRPEWPEAPYLVDWLRRHARCREIALEDLSTARLADHLDAVLSQAAVPAVNPTGIAQAADLIEKRLAGTTKAVGHNV